MIDVAVRSMLVLRAGVGSRIAPSAESAPAETALPRVVYTLIDDPPRYHDKGACGLRKATYQIDVFGKNYTEARNVALQITAPASRPENPGLDGYSGTIGDTQVLRVYFGPHRSGTATGAPGQNQIPARATVDVLIDYRSTTP